MKKINKKLLLGISSLAVASAPLAAVVSCGVSGNSFDAWFGSHRDLMITSNIKNTSNTTAFSFDGAKSNLSTIIQGIYPTLGRLMRKEVKTEVSPMKDKNGNFYVQNTSSKNFGSLIEPLKPIEEKIKLELVESITLSYIDKENGNQLIQNRVFTQEDIYDNEEEFRYAFSNATMIKLKIRDNMFWIDHNGNKTKFKITARDFLEGFRVNIMQYMGVWRRSIDKGLYADKVSNVEDDFNKTHGTQFNDKNTDNTYLYGLMGMDFKKIIGFHQNANTLIPEKDISAANSILTKNPKFISGKSNEDQRFNNDLTFNVPQQAILDGTAQPGLFLDKILLDDEQARAPSPYLYKKYLRKNTNFKYYINKNSTLDKLGFYSYGLTYKDKLYSGRYYVSDNTAFKNTIKQNTHHWDTDWVNDKHSIRSFTQNFRSLDASLLPKILFNNFKQGTEFRVSVKDVVSELSSKDKREAYDHWKDIKYSFSADSNKTLNSAPWTTNPIFDDYNKGDDESKQMVNNDLAKVLWGADKSVLKNGASITNHSATIGLAFRSQITALVNWYALKELLNKKGDIWNSFTPAGAILPDGKGGHTIASQSIYNSEDNRGNKIHTSSSLGVDYFSFAHNQLKHVGIVTPEEQIKAYRGSNIGDLGTPNSDKQSVLSAMKETLQNVFNDGKEHTIAFTYPIRGGLATAKYRNAYAKLAETIEKVNVDLGGGTSVKFKINELGGKPRSGYNPDFNKDILKQMTSNQSIATFNGWSSDTDALVSWYAGLVVSTSRASSALFGPMSLMADDNATGDDLTAKNNLDQIFPETSILAKSMNDKVDKVIKAINDQITSAADDSEFFVDLNTYNDVAGTKLSASSYSNLKNQIKNKFSQKGWFKDLHKLNNNEITGHDSVEYWFGDNAFKDINKDFYPSKAMSTKLKAEVNSKFSVAGSLAFFSIDTYLKATQNNSRLLQLEWELRNITGLSMVFDRGFVTPSAKLPSGWLTKPWLTKMTPNRNGVEYISEWRVK